MHLRFAALCPRQETYKHTHSRHRTLFSSLDMHSPSYRSAEIAHRLCSDCGLLRAEDSNALIADLVGEFSVELRFERAEERRADGEWTSFSLCWGQAD